MKKINYSIHIKNRYFETIYNDIKKRKNSDKQEMNIKVM